MGYQVLALNLACQSKDGHEVGSNDQSLHLEQEKYARISEKMRCQASAGLILSSREMAEFPEPFLQFRFASSLLKVLMLEIRVSDEERQIEPLDRAEFETH